MHDEVLAIPTEDVYESMRVLIASGKFERFAASDDVLVDRETGHYVYLVTFEAHEKLIRKIQEKEPREKLIGVVAVPCVEQARRVLVESGHFDLCPHSDNAVVDKKNGVQISLIPFSNKD